MQTGTKILATLMVGTLAGVLIANANFLLHYDI